MSKDLMQTKIIDKILEYKPDDVDTVDFMKHVFNTHTRLVSGYRVKSDLRMPGAMLTEDFLPDVKQHSDKYRNAHRHNLIWVRCDLVQPNHIEVEHNARIFVLTKEEWTKLKRYLKLANSNEDI